MHDDAEILYVHKLAATLLHSVFVLGCTSMGHLSNRDTGLRVGLQDSRTLARSS